MPKQIAIYGKGGIGKSTTTSNLSAALSDLGYSVMQIGCDPKNDSTTTLRKGKSIPTVLDTVRQRSSDLDNLVHEGYNGIYCVEAGGPEPGVGCAGRGIIAAIELLNNNGIIDEYDPDIIIYDVLGDVVCGGFAMPIREGKAKEIYGLIPDFGGFLVKANSEGQPGPMDYGRTHADGANLLAGAIRPYGGIVMWRAFINNPTDPDRAKQARLEFEHLDGKFLDNVIIQVKNGPIDFQPREPFNALFGALRQTAEMPEFQITQEYLGQANHLAYLGTMWEEFFSEVTQYADYKANQLNAKYNAIAGVANTGTDANWTGHPLAQSNWYAFGRMAWNPDLDAKTIANEWVSLTFPSLNGKQHDTVVSMLMRSREAAVDYEMPIGLTHQFGNSHYAPGAWDNRPIRRDWLPVFYNQADADGIGFDRTKATGTDNTSQYVPAFGGVMEDVKTCPDKYLLWFHHVSWNHKCQTGRSVWEELCYRYQNGLNEARQMQRQWNSLEGAIDQDIFRDVQTRLMTQTRDAEWWKDGTLLYFQSLNKKAFPDYECKKNRVHVGLYRSPTREELNRER